MSMTREQHLDRIIAKLDSLIACAKLRTPGRWCNEMPITDVRCDEKIIASTYVNDPRGTGEPQDEHDATFIASCAGNAEAGWYGLRASVIWLRNEMRLAEIMGDTGHEVFNVIDSIIAAWPEEMLDRMPPPNAPSSRSLQAINDALPKEVL